MNSTSMMTPLWSHLKVLTDLTAQYSKDRMYTAEADTEHSMDEEMKDVKKKKRKKWKMWFFKSTLLRYTYTKIYLLSVQFSEFGQICSIV